MPPWPRRRHSNTQITIASHARFLSQCWIKWNGTTARRYRLATMLVLDVLFGHFHRISFNVEIIGSLMSAIDVRFGSIASFLRWADYVRSSSENGLPQGCRHVSKVPEADIA